MRLVIFAGEKTTAMRNLYRFYSLFEKLLDEDLIFIDHTMDFRRLCKAIGAPCRKLDSLIFDELGMGGDDVIKCYRDQWERGLNAKYGKSFRFTPEG